MNNTNKEDLMDMILELWLCILIFKVQNIKGRGVKAWAVDFEMIYSNFCILKSLKVVFSFFLNRLTGPQNQTGEPFWKQILSRKI